MLPPSTMMMSASDARADLVHAAEQVGDPLPFVDHRDDHAVVVGAIGEIVEPVRGHLPGGISRAVPSDCAVEWTCSWQEC